ncbi:hypothetical protein [Diplocloster modestus]|uniref:Uncharacterized protein n=1 Tax=Diplocloster modestus TaxID=2850322 RepID=A0ABS6KC37_9FIRM|nr:hypothetical protein [Diplocloster modestus]MBU9728073.1 hypothetical protein [Diplocloster modestus]
MNNIYDWLAAVETAINLQDRLINDPGIPGVDIIKNQTWKQVHINDGIEKIAETVGQPLSESEHDSKYTRVSVIHNGIEYFQLVPIREGGGQDVA